MGTSNPDCPVLCGDSVSCRHNISKVIPTATKVAWQVKQNDIQKDLPAMTRNQFLYNLSRASYEKHWGKNYRKPNFGETFLAFLFRLIPKIGSLKILTFRTPTPETYKMFEASFNATLERYLSLLTELDTAKVVLPIDHFDAHEQPPACGCHTAIGSAQ